MGCGHGDRTHGLGVHPTPTSGRGAGPLSSRIRPLTGWRWKKAVRVCCCLPWGMAEDPCPFAEPPSSILSLLASSRPVKENRCQTHSPVKGLPLHSSGFLRVGGRGRVPLAWCCPFAVATVVTNSIAAALKELSGAPRQGLEGCNGAGRVIRRNAELVGLSGWRCRGTRSASWASWRAYVRWRRAPRQQLGLNSVRE